VYIKRNFVAWLLATMGGNFLQQNVTTFYFLYMVPFHRKSLKKEVKTHGENATLL